MSWLQHHAKGQAGYTLVELIITAALGALLMSAIGSIFLTSWRAMNIATSRVEASSQIRNFEYFAYEDFAAATVPSTGACGTAAVPCTTEPLTLSATAVNGQPPVPSSYQVTYVWDGSNLVNRQLGSATVHAATNVTSFSWFVDSGTPTPTVVINVTVQEQSYSESQTFRFHPRANP